jgi:GNAT superfamily N-acetyltransferase
MPGSVTIRDDVDPETWFETLAPIARREGFRFVDRLVEEWRTDANRFDRQHEAWLTAVHEGSVAGFGGLNIDPFSHQLTIGRLRRLYVLPQYRRMGVATLLTRTLLDTASGHFRVVRLRTTNADAAAFYHRMGFRAVDRVDATHELPLDAR